MNKIVGAKTWIFKEMGVPEITWRETHGWVRDLILWVTLRIEEITTHEANPPRNSPCHPATLSITKDWKFLSSKNWKLRSWPEETSKILLGFSENCYTNIIEVNQPKFKSGSWTPSEEGQPAILSSQFSFIIFLIYFNQDFSWQVVVLCGPSFLVRFGWRRKVRLHSLESSLVLRPP